MVAFAPVFKGCGEAINPLNAARFNKILGESDKTKRNSSGAVIDFEKLQKIPLVTPKQKK
jgi:hypothetical protein